jgi:hypothetical protein
MWLKQTGLENMMFFLPFLKVAENYILIFDFKGR